MDSRGSPRRRPPRGACATLWARVTGQSTPLRPDHQGDRIVYTAASGQRSVLVEHADVDLCDNVVATARYTPVSFIPIFLLEQFARFANAYFLLVACLQCIPSVSITGGIPLTFIPLSVVLTFDGIVTAREDYKRHVDDARANNFRTEVLREGRFVEVASRDIVVGDLLKLRRNRAVPADCVFLASVSEDLRQPDVCYVETSQLDGETSLKLRQAVPATVARLRCDADAASFAARVRCEAPNAAFDRFVGTIAVDERAPGEADAAAAAADATRHPALAPASLAGGGVEVELSAVAPRRVGGEAAHHNPLTAAVRAAGAAAVAGAPAAASSSSLSTPRAAASSGTPPPPPPAPAAGPHALESEQTLLRGSVLRNVDFAYALAVYTGRETKVRVRQTTFVGKRAQVESDINRMILCLVVLVFAFCFAGGIGGTEWVREHHGEAAYLRLGGRYDALTSLRQVTTYFLLNAGFIPVSLYVTVRLSRSLQMFFMERDAAMVHEDAALLEASGGADGRWPLKVRSMDLNDELGQITHVFSDKTGTLTLNNMEFRKLVVGGVAYGVGSTQVGADRRRRRDGAADTAGDDADADAAGVSAASACGATPHVNFVDGSETHPRRTLAGDAARPADGAQGALIHDFLMHCALNHSVLIEVVRDAGGRATGTRLSSSSPDEEAFLCAAQAFGYRFAGRTPDTVAVECRFAAAALPLRRALAAGVLAPPSAAPAAPLPGGGGGGCTLRVRVLHVLPYAQERKRMSVLVELPSVGADGAPVLGGGPIVLYCKGADSVVLPRCRDAAGAGGSDAVIRQTVRALAGWGNDGLRTLVFASRGLSRAEFDEWSRAYAAATNDIEQIRRRKAKQANAIDALMDGVEAGLTLQGATANEDKLQPLVPETVTQLSRAGVKVWMLTGDKQETAVNIAFATRLLDDGMRQVVATQEAAGGISAAVQRIRVAAKRIAAERARDDADTAAARTPVAAVVHWTAAAFAAAEAGLGFSGSVGRWWPSARDGHAGTTFDGLPPRAGGAAPRPLGGAISLSRPAVRSADKASPLLFDAAAASPPPRLAAGAAPLPPPPPPPGTAAPPTPTASLMPARLASILRLGVVSTRPTPADGAGSARAPATDATGASQPYAGPTRGAWAPGGAAAPPVRTRADSFASEDGEVDGAGALDRNVFADDGGGGSPGVAAAHDGVVPGAVAATHHAHAAQRRPYALVIDEHVLDAALAHPRTRAYLLYTTSSCAAVVCCRARPDQKARVVLLVKSGVPGSRTLAVGDGANDVDMIRCAHVGVGIAGAEGVQASNASDYSIGRFHFLQRLLLVHGRWNYMRMSKIVLYTFWKNIVFVTAQFWFAQLAAAASGQKFYIEFGTQMFNLVFVSLPTIVLGVYDTDVSAAAALRYPQLYDYSRERRGLNLRVFLQWVGGALLESALVYFFVAAAYARPAAAWHGGAGVSGAGDGGSGATPYVFELGTVAFTAVLAVVTLRIGAEMHSHHAFFSAVAAVSVGLWLPSCFVYDAMNADGMRGGMARLWGSATTWASLGAVVGASGVRLVAWKGWRRLFAPELRHIVQEAVTLTHDTKAVDAFVAALDAARRSSDGGGSGGGGDTGGGGGWPPAPGLDKARAESWGAAPPAAEAQQARNAARGGGDGSSVSGESRRLVISVAGAAASSGGAAAPSPTYSLPPVASEGTLARVIIMGGTVPRGGSSTRPVGVSPGVGAPSPAAWDAAAAADAGGGSSPRHLRPAAAAARHHQQQLLRSASYSGSWRPIGGVAGAGATPGLRSVEADDARTGAVASGASASAGPPAATGRLGDARLHAGGAMFSIDVAAADEVSRRYAAFGRDDAGAPGAPPPRPRDAPSR